MAERAGTAYYDIPEGAFMAGVPPPEAGTEKEDMEIAKTVARLDLDKEFTIEEYGALLHVLQVNARFWPMNIKPEEFIQAERFGEAHNWFWSTKKRKEIMDEKKDDLLLARAQAIPWAQSFALRRTSKNLEGYMRDNGNGLYPTYMQSFSSKTQLAHERLLFVETYNPKPFEPPEEKSNERSGGMGFLIGAVIILLLALGILTYFLLR